MSINPLLVLRTVQNPATPRERPSQTLRIARRRVQNPQNHLKLLLHPLTLTWQPFVPVFCTPRLCR
jgi:hypothetical protein